MATTDMILGKFTLNSRVSFQVYPSALYGDIFKNCVPTDQISAASGVKFGVDPEAEHAKVYPFLPSGTKDDARSYSWLVLTLEDGQQRVIGLPWIKVDTIVSVTVTNAVATIPGIGSGDVEKIRLALSGAGFQNVTIATTSS